jgi:hypothetical protein
MNLFLTLLSKTGHSGSILFKVGNCAPTDDVEMHLCAPHTQTNTSGCVYAELLS